MPRHVCLGPAVGIHLVILFNSVQVGVISWFVGSGRGIGGIIEARGDQRVASTSKGGRAAGGRLLRDGLLETVCIILRSGDDETKAE